MKESEREARGGEGTGRRGTGRRTSVCARGRWAANAKKAAWGSSLGGLDEFVRDDSSSALGIVLRQRESDTIQRATATQLRGVDRPARRTRKAGGVARLERPIGVGGVEVRGVHGRAQSAPAGAVVSSESGAVGFGAATSDDGKLMTPRTRAVKNKSKKTFALLSEGAPMAHPIQFQ